MIEIIPIPAFHDNYIWLIRQGNMAVVVDPGEAAPVRDVLERQKLSLVAILTTHHHADHVGGVEELVRTWPVPVYGPRSESIAVVDRPLEPGSRVHLPEIGLEFDVIDVGGHTLGHIAYSGDGVLFSGDTLFAGGCGRIFEGTTEQMWQSLERLLVLPDDTRVYCAHEYTAANLRFAVEVEPSNAALHQRVERVSALRAEGRPTVPTSIELERATNPFLRVSSPEVIAAATKYRGHALHSDAEIFGALRDWKNVF
jgi:hydroxyacylglutathione hydrolase